ncbi:MAG: hypothetical protein ACLP9L_16195 [Thermoguttaceae bacterium]
MSVQVLRGSKQEIAEKAAGISGEVREVIVFIEEPSRGAGSPDDIFAEMEPLTVRAGGADFSREAIYSRMEGE